MNTNFDASDWRTIDGKPPSLRGYCQELYAMREIAYVLIRRDLIVRFRQTYFGLAWLLFKPLMLMLVMSFVFGALSGFEKSQIAPYSLVILCGVIPWYFVTNAIPDSMNALRSHVHVIQKTYFPRAIIPIAVIAVDAIEFVVAWVLFAIGSLWFAFIPGWQIILFPLLCLQLVLLCAGVGLWLSVLAIKFRDVANLVPFLLTIGFFVTPVGYTLKQVPMQWQWIYVLNPLVGIIEGLRWSLLHGAEEFPYLALVLSVAITLVIGLLAIHYFLANEADLVDQA